MEECRSAFNILTGKLTGKTSLGRPRRRWEDNIKMDLKEIGIDMRNWVDSAQDRDYTRVYYIIIYYYLWFDRLVV